MSLTLHHPVSSLTPGWERRREAEVIREWIGLCANTPVTILPPGQEFKIEVRKAQPQNPKKINEPVLLLPRKPNCHQEGQERAEGGATRVVTLTMAALVLGAYHSPQTHDLHPLPCPCLLESPQRLQQPWTSFPEIHSRDEKVRLRAVDNLP